MGGIMEFLQVMLANKYLLPFLFYFPFYIQLQSLWKPGTKHTVIIEIIYTSWVIVEKFSSLLLYCTYCDVWPTQKYFSRL